MGLKLHIILPILTVLTCCQAEGENMGSIQTPPTTCQTSHWIISALSFFTKYQNGVEQILKASSPPTSISTDISRGLQSVHTKLSFLTSFSQGKQLRSPSQELWARGFLRFYLSQASSSVLNHIGAFAIGTQVSLINLCAEMVDDIRRNATNHVNLCSKRLGYLRHTHIQSGVCLNLASGRNQEVTLSARASLSTLITPMEEASCTDIWTPVVTIVQSTLSKVTALFLAHSDPAIKVTLAPSFKKKVEETQQFRTDLVSGKFKDIEEKSKTQAEWYAWGGKRFKQLNSESAALVDAVFDKLGPVLQQTLGELCRAFMKVLATASALQKKCLKIERRPGDRVCFLSNKAMGLPGPSIPIAN